MKLCVLLRKSELYKGKSANRRHFQYLRLINLVCERSPRIANYFLFSVMDTASGAIMGVMLATMVAMQAMAMVAITVLDTDTMVESDAAMGTVPLYLALLENRKIRNIYIFFS